MKKTIFITLYIMLTCFLASCARNVDCEVTAFHTQPLPQGETINIQVINPANIGSIQFREYAELISENLRAIGYTPVSASENATLIAEVDYGINTIKSKIRTTTDPYVLYHFSRGRYRYPYYYGYHGIMDPPYYREYTETVYNRTLVINIFQAASIDIAERKVIFETSVSSTGRESNLTEIMPYLVSAAFTNFPGESGVAKIITIEKDQ